jgi:hypothetical protein
MQSKANNPYKVIPKKARQTIVDEVIHVTSVSLYNNNADLSVQQLMRPIQIGFILSWVKIRNFA